MYVSNPDAGDKNTFHGFITKEARPPDLPTSVIVTTIAAFKKRLKGGTSYTHNGVTWQVSVPLVKAVIIKALPKLQKIITKRKKLKTP